MNTQLRRGFSLRHALVAVIASQAAGFAWATICYIETVGDSCAKYPTATGPCPPLVIDSGDCGSTSTSTLGDGHVAITSSTVDCVLQIRKVMTNGGCMDDYQVTHHVNCKWENLNSDSCTHSP